MNGPILASSYQHGASPAILGSLRLSNGAGSAIYARNAANSADYPLVYLDGSNVLILGSGSAAIFQNLTSPSISLGYNGTPVYVPNLKVAGLADCQRRGSSGTQYSGNDPAIVVSSGWGNAAVAEYAAGTDQHLQFNVACSGTGQTPSPTITITYKDGTYYPENPIYYVASSGYNAAPNITWVAGATQLVITCGFTPSAGNGYIFNVLGMGVG